MKITGSGKKLFLFILISLIGSVVFGQARKPYSKSNLMAEMKVEYGFLLSHHLELDKFQSHFPAFEFSIEKQTHGRQQWEAEYAYPIIGISAWYSPLGGFEQIGSALAVYPFINFPLVKNDVQSLNFRLGVGVGYLTNYYQRIENYENFAIGSHLNVAGRLYFEYRRKLNRLMNVSAGLGLTHFSNGSIKNPNYGLNMITGTVSVSIFLQKPNPYYSRKVLPELYPFEFDGRKYLDVDFSFAVARKNMSEVYGQNFAVFGAYANLMKRVSYKSAFGIGLDLVYDGSDKYILDRDSNVLFE
ncbi:MAG TPA: acyloxyacyl hydrolase, partial [Bacteroidales bacterium]